MNNKFCFSIIFALSICLISCSEKPPTKKLDIVAKINGYELSLSEFEEKLVEDLNMEKDFKSTKEAKKELLEQFIREELLLQEAVKLKIDRKDKFIKAIERYWKATLIRDIIELKTELFSRITYATQEEIEARYNEMKKSNEVLLPLQEIRDKIAKKLVEQKKREKLVSWINELRKKADIEINEELLDKS